MCNDWGKYGIRVNAIGPGWVKTEMTQALQNNPERFAAISSRIPLGRWAEPGDLAGLAVFLASEASAYITGQVIFHRRRVPWPCKGRLGRNFRSRGKELLVTFGEIMMRLLPRRATCGFRPGPVPWI